MRIFSDKARSRYGPPTSNESMFSYLDESARPEVELVRKTVEGWLEGYPSTNFDHWLGDFCSSNDGAHQSAFFELFLFRYFVAIGWEVLAVEPEIDGVTGNPDFLLRDSTGKQVVVEAISPSYRSDKELKRDSLAEDIKDAINSVISPNHYLILKKLEPPKNAVKKRPIAEAIEKWLLSDPRRGDIFHYIVDELVIEIEAYPRPGRDISSVNYRSIGVEIGKFTVSTPGADVKAALLKKAQKYKGIKIPYVIALNARKMHDSEDDFISATYGVEKVVVTLNPDGGSDDHRWERDTNGLFNDGGKLRKRHVSAVLVFDGIQPWSWREHRSCTIHNEGALQPLEGACFGGDAFFPEHGVLRKVEGKDVGELML